jgi:hypothetical protein
MLEAATHGALWGFAAGIGLAAVLLGAARVEPEVMLRGYPADIRDAHGEAGPRARRVGAVAGVVAATLVIGSAVAALATLGSTSFDTTFPALAAFLLAVQIVDLVVLDWLIFLTLQPSFVVLPGTEGMAGYRDLGHHVRGFARASVVSLVIAAIVAAVLDVGGAWVA